MEATSNVNNITDAKSSKTAAKRLLPGLTGLPGVDALSFEQLLGDSAAQLGADTSGLVPAVEGLPKADEKESELSITVDASISALPGGEASAPATMLQAWQAWLARGEAAPATTQGEQGSQSEALASVSFARVQGRETGTADERESELQLPVQQAVMEEDEPAVRLPQTVVAGVSALKLDGESSGEPSGIGAGKDMQAALSLGQFEARKTPPAQPVPVVQIGVPLRAPEWSNAFSEQIVLLVNDGGGRAELRLNPAELGPIDVSLRVQDDRVHATFTIQHAATVDAVQAALPKLEQMMAERGVQLDRVSVEGGERQPEQNSQQARGGSGGQGQGQSRGGSERDAQQSPARVLRRNGLVDTFA